MDLQSDELEMRVYADNTSVRGADGFRMILELLEKSFLPRPTELEVTDKRNRPTSGYLDQSVLQALDRKKHFVELINRDSGLTVRVSQAPDNSSVGIHIQATLAATIPAGDLRKLFIDLIAAFGSPTYGVCRLAAHGRALHQAAYAQARRTFYASGLYWLNFFGPDEIARQGGKALADNPVAVVNQLPQGLLIQVGDDPFRVATPSGEQKLKEATAAMPPLGKDEAKKDEATAKRELITIAGVRGFFDPGQVFWVPKHVDASAKLDEKTIAKLKRLLGKGDPSVKQINVLFSRKETALLNRTQLAEAGLQSWYVDPESGQAAKA